MLIVVVVFVVDVDANAVLKPLLKQNFIESIHSQQLH